MPCSPFSNIQEGMKDKPNAVPYADVKAMSTFSFLLSSQAKLEVVSARKHIRDPSLNANCERSCMYCVVLLWVSDKSSRLQV